MHTHRLDGSELSELITNVPWWIGLVDEMWIRCLSRGILGDKTRSANKLFQIIWVNLPRERKFDEPAIRYVGEGTDHPWKEHFIGNDTENLGRRV